MNNDGNMLNPLSSKVEEGDSMHNGGMLEEGA